MTEAFEAGADPRDGQPGADWARFVASWLERARDDAQLTALGTATEFAFVLRCGGAGVWLRVVEGRVAEHALGGTSEHATDFELVAPKTVWDRFWQLVPPPCYQSLYALAMRVPEFSVVGSQQRLAQNVHVVARLLALGRPPASSPPAVGAQPDVEAIAGRYVRVELPEGESRVYVEEAGAGPALLLLHTAGSDSRQYHGLLGDPALAKEWRLVAFDLPCHGRSSPPRGMLAGAWGLTTDRYVATIRAVVARLGLECPVVLGCSMGGQICLELAYRHPDEFAAVIACEAAAVVPGRQVAWAKHPYLNQSLFVPEWIDGLMGPATPDEHRAEVRWAYSQGAYGVFFGDIEFYSGDWDARDRIAAIDTARCPVHLLTGEYDYSCTPAMSRATAGRIPGATFRELPGLGHFPMAENPSAFLAHLRPVLATVRSTLGRSG